ncbi:MAG: hypothetical protein AAF945_09150 [Actinomycetota bacterium]
MQGEAARDGDRIWRPDGDDLWVDSRAREPERDHAPTATALVDPSRLGSTTRAVDDDGVRDRTTTGHGAPAADGDGSTERTRRSRRSFRRAAIGTTVVAGLVMAVVAVRTTTAPGELTGTVTADAAALGDSIEPVEPFAGADPRRLPATAPLRWSRELDLVADRGSSVTVHGDEIAVGIFAAAADDDPTDDGATVATIVGFDATTGDTLWTSDYPTETRSLDPLGVIDGVMVVEWLDTGNRALLGIALADGTELWRLDTNDVGIHGIVPGTDLVTRFSFSSTPRLTFIDPATGDLAGRVTGRFVGTDYSGRWWIRRTVRDGSLATLDLRDGFSEPEPLSGVDAGEPDLLAVVGGVPLGTIDGRIVTPDASGAWVDAPIDSEVDPDPPDVVFAFSPAADDLFVFAGSGTVYGAVVVDDGDPATATGPPTIDVRWRLGGRVARALPSERGLLLEVEDQGGSGRSVVDGPTGRVLAEVEDIADGDLLELVGNGFLTARSAGLGVERVAYDLDGREMWTLVGAGPLEVGDGVVVNWSPTPDGIRLTAFGATP